MAVLLRLAKGFKPGRPESRTLDDSHWHLIQHCLSAIEERPAAEVIIFTIEQFLSHCPHSPPLCDLLLTWSSRADLEANSSSSLSQAPTEGSSLCVFRASSDEDEQNRYIMMTISAHSILLTSRCLRLLASHRILTERAWAHPTRVRNAICC